MLRIASLLAALFVFWTLMSGMIEPFLLALGAASVGAVAWLARRMEVADREGHPSHLRPLAVLSYWFWLFGEIWRSGLKVARIILDPRLPVSPTLVTFRPAQQTAVGLATHANSITLTPGTLTIAANHQEFLVHALTREDATALVDSEMNRRVRDFEGSE
ncbi:MAG: Na+/H+ antiporter subunit E [Burkholderiales bacterium]|nr:Na+/H+ antiporter subunit E [Burkholderiales bacterium]